MDLEKNGELNSHDVPESVRKEAAEVRKQHNSCSNDKIREEQFGTGCLSCGADDDHANLLLCEMCNAEYHTYVQNPNGSSIVTLLTKPFSTELTYNFDSFR